METTAMTISQAIIRNCYVETDDNVVQITTFYS